MEIFLDTADLLEIESCLSSRMIDGVTTNPSILLKNGAHDFERRAKEIADLIYPLPLSVEVTTNDHQEMIDQATEFAAWNDNIAVKIPIVNESGSHSLGVVSALAEQGVKVNLTACLSFGQVAMGAKAGATYISIFAGRVGDEGHDASKLIRQSVDWLKEWNFQSKIIVGSIRAVMDLQVAALAGAHVITTPSELLYKWIDHKYSRETVRVFNEDARKAMEISAERSTFISSS